MVNLDQYGAQPQQAPQQPGAVNATPFHIFMDHLLAHMQATHAMQPGAGVQAPPAAVPPGAVPPGGTPTQTKNTSAVTKGNPLRDALIQGSKPLQAHLLQLLTSHG